MKEKGNGQTCSLFQTGEYIGCQNTLEYNNLGLKYKKRNSISGTVINPILRELPQIKNMTEEDFNALVQQKVDELFTEDMQEIKHSLSDEKELVVKKLTRLFDYFRTVTAGSTVIFNMPFEVDCEEYFNGVISKVKDTANFTYEKDGKRVAVRIHSSGKQTASNAARTLEKNRYQNQASLALMYLGLAAEGEPLTCEDWYVNAKEDKNGRLSDKYETKKGDNIASHTYSSKEEAKEALAKAISFGCENCSDCRHALICEKKKALYKPETKVAKELVNRQLKEPKFTESQKKVVLHKEGPMAVVAVPGAGKTTSLVHRLKRLLEEGIDADNILFITFTNKAAGEIKERVEALLPEGSNVPEVKTFNAFGYSILRDNKELLGRTLCLASDTAKKALVKECLERVPKISGRSYHGATGAFGIITSASKLIDDIGKNGKEWFSTTYYGKLDVDGFLRLYDEYVSQYKERNYITFDEQVSLALKLFKEHPELTKAYAERYKYIMVDEYQDTNAEQAELIYAIAQHHNNIVVVGDDDQTIYDWRGGSAEFMLNFKNDFADAELVFMEDNFRSNDKILEAANALIDGNTNRFKKQILPHSTALSKPVSYQSANTDKLIIALRTLLQKYMPGEIAVLGRDNKNLRALIPFISQLCKVANPKDYLIDDYVFLTVYDVLGLYCDINNDVALYRLLKHFGADVPAKTDKTKSLYDNLIQEAYLTPIDMTDPDYFYAYEDKEERNPLEEAAYRIFKTLKGCQYFSTMDEMFNLICAALDIPEEQIVVSQLKEIADISDFKTIAQLHTYMGQMVEYSDMTRVAYTPAPDTLQLMTCHDSKGKEFPCVIIYGVEAYDESEKDKRLLYVGMTRAKNTLILMRTAESRENCLSTIGSYLEHR